MFAWVTHRSLPSLERPADFSPSIERLSDLSLRLRDQRTSSLCLSDQRISPFVWETSWPLPFAWATSGSLPSVQIYKPYILSQVPSGNMNILFTSCIFCLWLVNGTYILPFFPVICWSYLKTEIYVTLSMGNKLYSSPSSFPVKTFCWCYITTTLTLQNSSSPAKLVYYTISIFGYATQYINKTQNRGMD